MTAAFQRNAFQNNAFQTGTGITDTMTAIQLPINAVMIGNQPYRKVEREYDMRDPSPRRRLTGQVSKVAQLGPAPSYEVKSTSRGYV